jgi:hypothetical protein
MSVEELYFDSLISDKNTILKNIFKQEVKPQQIASCILLCLYKCYPVYSYALESLTFPIGCRGWGREESVGVSGVVPGVGKGGECWGIRRGTGGGEGRRVLDRYDTFDVTRSVRQLQNTYANAGKENLH